MLGAAIALVAFAIPTSAYAVLTNEYGMRYAGRDKCLVCHEASTNKTTHGQFARPGANPATPGMYPVGRPGVGMMVGKADIGFTLGGGTGPYQYLTINPAAVPGGTSVAYAEVQGATRYDTAVAASRSSFPAADTVVVATGEAFPDALGGAGLAGAVRGPLLLTPKSAVPASVIAEIRRLGATRVYVLGGASAVSDAAFAQLEAVAPTTRLAGVDRYETGALVAQETVNVLGAGFGGAAFMATGANYPDALAASPIMYAKGMPLVLVRPNGGYVLPGGVTRVKIVGGAQAVPASVEAGLGAAHDAPRIAGANRYDTAARVAEHGVSLGMSWNGVAVATGESFPDALAAGPAAGAKNAVMALTATRALSDPAAARLAANKASISACTFIGGPGAVSAKTRTQVKSILARGSALDPTPFKLANFSWNPAAPETWEFPSTGVSSGDYWCGGCHHLGWTAKGEKPAFGKFAATASAATRNAWVSDPASALPAPERYQAGASIQCEVCHGTGEAGPSVDNHKGALSSYVKKLPKAQLLDSQVCGQCHDTLKTGNTLGYTPDQNLLTFGTRYGFGDIPSEAAWNDGVNAATGKPWLFFPNGQNRGMKHSYYTEWALSAHSYRGAYSDPVTGHLIDDPRLTEYQRTIGGHYSPKAVFASVKCARCHTGEGYAKRKNLAIMSDFTPTADNTGYMGTECVTCHVPHGAGNETGMAVRRPDSAPTLTGIRMTSVCEDCHNWELEMEELPLVTDPRPVDANWVPARDLSERGGYSHPTREIYNGVGLFDVPAGGVFMPGVACEDCHMPATKSDAPSRTGLERDRDRSSKRYSHRMFIMEPGKAAEWGLAPWGDSCSPCHPGQTQSELQQHLDGWRADTADAYDEAADAYTGAWTIADGPGAVEAPASIAFQTLVGRAYYNIRAYLGEGSLGAHNPGYITAGLEAATQMAKSVNGTFAYVSQGSAYAGVEYVVGTVHNGDGSGASGAEIEITIDGAPTTVRSDANGNFVLTFASGGSIDSICWKRCADTDADLYVH